MTKPKANQKKVGSNENTGQIVLSAIKKLMKNTGWTSRTIVKFIKIEFGINDDNLSRRVARALRNGVRLGLLQKDRGRYRLDQMSRLVKPSAKRAAKRLQQARKAPHNNGIRIRSSVTSQRKPKSSTNTKTFHISSS